MSFHVRHGMTLVAAGPRRTLTSRMYDMYDDCCCWQAPHPSHLVIYECGIEGRNLTTPQDPSRRNIDLGRSGHMYSFVPNVHVMFAEQLRSRYKKFTSYV